MATKNSASTDQRPPSPKTLQLMAAADEIIAKQHERLAAAQKSSSDKACPPQPVTTSPRAKIHAKGGSSGDMAVNRAQDRRRREQDAEEDELPRKRK